MFFFRSTDHCAFFFFFLNKKLFLFFFFPTHNNNMFSINLSSTCHQAMSVFLERFPIIKQSVTNMLDHIMFCFFSFALDAAAKLINSNIHYSMYITTKFTKVTQPITCFGEIMTLAQDIDFKTCVKR